MGTRSTLTVSREVAIETLRAALDRGDLPNDTLEALLEPLADLAVPAAYNFIVQEGLQRDDEFLRDLTTPD